MNGIKLVLDSTCVIDFLKNMLIMDDLGGSVVGIERYVSVITRMEALAYPSITPDEILRIRNFLGTCIVVPLDSKIEEVAIKISLATRKKLPDCIVAATGVIVGATIISRDDHLLDMDWPGLSVVSRL
jgi:predicted nucleic acid-binding protein